MINESLRKEVEEKLKRRLDNSYVIISIGDLRELIPDLYKLTQKQEEPKKLLKQPSDPTTPKYKKIVEDDEIITIAELERRLIRAALEKTNGCVEKAALELGISERNLYRKFIEFGIDHNKYKKKC